MSHYDNDKVADAHQIIKQAYNLMSADICLDLVRKYVKDVHDLLNEAKKEYDNGSD